ncbi:hypothetical protein J7L06_08950 [Candidatus Bathyarchaeota archaeon]|nr:hypothetical protein [Candidatus Bathyarchaeota archaeon]
MDREELFKIGIVRLILSGEAERALKLLSRYYHVPVPELKVGLPKGHRRVMGCYIADKRTIYIADRQGLRNPHLILHEFYHHLRSRGGKHRGTERYADRFAEDYIQAYRRAVSN